MRGAPGIVGTRVLVMFFSDSLNAIMIGRPITIVPDKVKALWTKSTEASSTYATLSYIGKHLGVRSISNDNLPFRSTSDSIRHHTSITHRALSQLFLEEHSDIPRREGSSQLGNKDGPGF